VGAYVEQTPGFSIGVGRGRDRADSPPGPSAVSRGPHRLPERPPRAQPDDQRDHHRGDALHRREGEPACPRRPVRPGMGDRPHTRKHQRVREGGGSDRTALSGVDQLLAAGLVRDPQRAALGGRRARNRVVQARSEPPVLPRCRTACSFQAHVGRRSQKNARMGGGPGQGVHPRLAIGSVRRADGSA
jgi:hypothetical protein